MCMNTSAMGPVVYYCMSGELSLSNTTETTTNKTLGNIVTVVCLPTLIGH